MTPPLHSAGLLASYGAGSCIAFFQGKPSLHFAPAEMSLSSKSNRGHLYLEIFVFSSAFLSHLYSG